MIYVSPNFVIPEGGNVNSPAIGYLNLIGSLVTSSQDPLYPSANMKNTITYLKWKAFDHVGGPEDESITMNFDGVTPLDYVGVAVHNFGSTGSVITLEAGYDENLDSVLEWETLVGPLTPEDDTPLLLRFNSITPLALRLLIEDSTGRQEVAILYAGELLLMQRNLYVGHAPINLSPQTDVISGRSESGHFLGRILTSRTFSTTASFNNLTPSWVRAKLLPFIEYAQEYPFFFAWRPGGYPQEVAFAWLTAGVKPTNQLPNGMMNFDLSMNGVITL